KPPKEYSMSDLLPTLKRIKKAYTNSINVMVKYCAGKTNKFKAEIAVKGYCLCNIFNEEIICFNQ
ncbi:MAG: hypothetical protein V5786_05765, partial [Psychromonas sp.]